MHTWLNGGTFLARLDGNLGLREAREAAIAAVREAAERGCYRVLVDVTGASALVAPTFIARIEIAHELAAAAVEGMALAMVAPTTVIDDQRIGAVLATRLGLRAYISDDFEDALDWLSTQKRLTNAVATAEVPNT